MDVKKEIEETTYRNNGWEQVSPGRWIHRNKLLFSVERNAPPLPPPRRGWFIALAALSAAVAIAGFALLH